MLDLRVTSCPSSGGVTIATEASPGYLSNTLYAAYSSLGWYSCPWIIHAQPGQRIQLTLITLQASHVEFLQLKTIHRVKLRHTESVVTITIAVLWV